MKITVIIPSFNEAPTIQKVINKVLSQKLPYQKEIIVVNDGSTDQTAEVLKKFSDKQSFSSNKIKIIINRRNLGKGASIIKALKKATGDITIIQDADLEYDPVDFPKLLALFKNKNVKVVYGSRVLGNNPISHWTFNLGGRVVTILTNILFGTNITDEATGYKLFRTNFLKKFQLKSKGFEFCPEVTAKIAKAGIKIYEVPIRYSPRPVKEKKIKWHDGIAAIFYLFKYRFFN